MIFAINLYHKKVLKRNEIGNVHPNNMLTTKMDSKFIGLEFFP